MDLLSDALHAIDGSRKSLGRLIPNYRELCESPRRYLSEREVVIGGAPFWALSCMMGVLVFMVPVVGLGITFDVLQKNWVPLPKVVAGLYSMLYLACIVLPFWAVPRLLPCRTILLRPGAVIFTERRRQVFCPWSLFRAQGMVHRTREDRVLVPVNSEAVSLVRVLKDGEETAAGWATKTSFFSLCPAPDPSWFWGWLRTKLAGTPQGLGDHAKFHDAYKAQGLEIGVMLMDLAWQMEP